MVGESSSMTAVHKARRQLLKIVLCMGSHIASSSTAYMRVCFTLRCTSEETVKQ